MFPTPNFRKVTLDTHPAWQFDVKIDHQINDKHKIGGRYSRRHEKESAPTVVGNGDFSDGVIYTTDVQNANLEYNWAIRPTALWTNRFSIDRVHGPGQSNHLSDVERRWALPAILNQNGLDRIPAINVGDDFLSMFTQCCVDTHFAHTLYSYSSGLQWVKGPHSIKFGGEQRVFFQQFPATGQSHRYLQFHTRCDHPGSQRRPGRQQIREILLRRCCWVIHHRGLRLHIVPSVADKSVDTAFYVQDDWKVTPKLTLNLGLRYEWSTPYTERTNQLQFSDFSGDTGITIPVSRSADDPSDPNNPNSTSARSGTVIGTTVFATSGHRNARVDRNNFAPRLGFAFQLASNTVVRGGAGVFYGMNVATNFQYAGPSFSKSAPFYFTTDNFETQYATLANPFPGRAGATARENLRKVGELGIRQRQ